MTRRPPLRLARPGQLPAPSAGPDSLQILDQAIDQLARLRTPYWLGELLDITAATAARRYHGKP